MKRDEKPFRDAERKNSYVTLTYEFFLSKYGLNLLESVAG
jgi:hypothetical protein